MPISNIAVLKTQPVDATGPTQDDGGTAFSNAYQQNHYYLSRIPKPNPFANLKRRLDSPGSDGFPFECGIGVRIEETEGLRVYLGVVFIVLAQLRAGEPVEHTDYPTVDAALDDGWEVD